MPSPPRPIYLDHQATTPVDRRVLDAMLPFFTDEFGNPASKTHPYGWVADEAVAAARAHVAALIGAEPREIVFTSGATEATNLALKGLVRPRLRAREGAHIVTAATEHKATLDVAHALAREGARLTVLAVDHEGGLDEARVRAALDDDTTVVSLMHANNEIGTVHDVAQIGALVRARGAAFHVDAAQSLSTLAVDVKKMGIDLLSLSAHKLYGPKGVGALFVRRGLRLEPQQDGGGHERGHRSGTLNVPGIVGLGEAARIARETRDAEEKRLATLRDLLLARLRAALPELVVHGSLERRLAGNLSVAIPFVEAETLLLKTCREVALSTGSACTQASLEPSHVLRALGVPHDLAHATVRIGLGRSTSEDDVARAAQVLIEAARAIAAGSSVARAAHRTS